MTDSLRCWRIENALRALHDAVMDAIEQNPRIKISTTTVLAVRLGEAREALKEDE